MTAIKGIVAIFLATGAALASAEPIYKYQRPDGTVIYSDSSIKGAKLIGQLDLPPPPPAAARRPQVPAADYALAEQRLQALDVADARIAAAAQALKSAEERQQQAIEPLPGERRGIVGGHSRLTPEYFARQRAIAAEVDAARADLDQAYRLRNDLRE